MAYAYFFGVTCPKKGEQAGLVLPHCNSDAMKFHLAQINRRVAARAYAVVKVYKRDRHSVPETGISPFSAEAGAAYVARLKAEGFYDPSISNAQLHRSKKLQSKWIF